jgi:tRNA(Phe) wybutosine-synthesizing methylase Tyw3
MTKHNLSFTVDWKYIKFLRYLKEEDFNRSTWLENELEEKIEERGWEYEE